MGYFEHAERVNIIGRGCGPPMIGEMSIGDMNKTQMQEELVVESLQFFYHNRIIAPMVASAIVF